MTQQWNGTNDVFTFDYVNGPEVISIGVVLPIVCIGITTLRFWTRFAQKTYIGPDDYLILGGLFCVVGMGISLIYGGAVKVMGYPTPPFPADLTTKTEILNYNPPSSRIIGILLLITCYGFTKTSIVFLYRRIFITHRNSLFDWVTKVTIVVVFLWMLAFIFIIIFPCGTYIKANWGTPQEQLDHCMTIGYTSEDGFAASDFILDVILMVMPLPSIWHLRMSTGKKWAVSGIFILGLGSVGAGTARLVLYVEEINAALKGIDVDQNQILTLTLWWSMLECGLAVIAACLPTLAYLFTGRSMQSAVASVRSRISLSSSKFGSASSRAASNKGGVGSKGSSSSASRSHSSHSVADGDSPKAIREFKFEDVELGPYKAALASPVRDRDEVGTDGFERHSKFVEAHAL